MRYGSVYPIQIVGLLLNAFITSYALCTDIIVQCHYGNFNNQMRGRMHDALIVPVSVVDTMKHNFIDYRAYKV